MGGWLSAASSGRVLPWFCVLHRSHDARLCVKLAIDKMTPLGDRVPLVAHARDMRRASRILLLNRCGIEHSR